MRRHTAASARILPSARVFAVGPEDLHEFPGLLLQRIPLAVTDHALDAQRAAQTGAAARPCFAADVTVTMLAFKPGLVVPAAARWTGAVRLAKLEGPEALEA